LRETKGSNAGSNIQPAIFRVAVFCILNTKVVTKFLKMDTLNEGMH